MRRAGATNRGFAGGAISRNAMRTRGFSFGTTSDNPRPLTRDDGAAHQPGPVRRDHAIDAQHNRPHSRGFQNPERDYGPADMGTAGHIDGSHTRPQYPAGAGYTKQADRPVQASNQRALNSSASETWMQQWYGYPAKRQER
jgi:hypothetical protein